MRKYLHILWISLASILIWIALWKLMGQDLNAFARPILTGLILANVIVTLVITFVIMTLLRFIKQEWLRPFPVFLWVTWLLNVIAFILIVILGNQ